MDTEKKTKKTPSVNLYMTDDNKILLRKRADLYGISPSKLVTGVVKFLEKLPLDKDEEIVAAAIKKAFGREQFVAFLRGTGEAIAKYAEPVISNGDGKAHANEFKPDMWVAKEEGILFLAYFAPTSENFGKMLTRCFEEKAKHGAKQMIVVCNDTSSIPREHREELRGIKITFVNLADLRIFLERAIKPAKKPTRRK